MDRKWTDKIPVEVLYNDEYIMVDVIVCMEDSDPEPEVGWSGGLEMKDYYCVDEKYEDALRECSEAEVFMAWEQAQPRVYG